MLYHSFYRSFLHSFGSVVISMMMLFAVSAVPAGFLFAEEGDAGAAGEPASEVQSENIDISSEEQGDPIEVSDEAIPVENSAEDNQEGQDGLNGEAPGGAVIETGDAVSEADVSNTVNTNVVDTSASTTPDDVSSEESVDSLNGEDTTDLATTTTVSIHSENHATSTTAATSTAQTGTNMAETGGGDASISTGDAFAAANVINAVNSNFVGSNGTFQLLNLFGNIFGELSLSMENGAGCSFLCFLTDLFISHYNAADILNNVAVNAFTGGNTALSADGSAEIFTGNAFAAANVVNLVNTDMVGSDYIAFIMNTFGSWEGDLVLPPESFFQEGTLCCGGGTTVIENTNTAEIGNNIKTGADSGENSANSETGAGSVETGNASAVSHAVTIANTNMFGNNLLLMYVRTGGSWSGRIFSLPSGINIIGMDDGFIIDGFSSHLGMRSLAGVSGTGSTTVINKNSARIINNVSAMASTGGNFAIGGGGARVSTGNAFAAANVVNIANTNIIGKNWLLAILNIFGDWKGDVAFGRPDVWVGASAEGPSPLGDGAAMEFTVTYRNNGNAPATQSLISFHFGENFRVKDVRGGLVDEEAHTIAWNAGTINPGGTGSFTFTAQAHNSSIGDSQGLVFASTNIHEDDANITDNTDQLLLDFYNKPPEGFLGYHQIYARLEIKKERAGDGVVRPGEEVPYKITVENKGSGNAYTVHVEDEMRRGETVVSTQEWDLDTVLPGEKVIIEYAVAFAPNTPAGTYVNYALAEWYDDVGNYVDHSGHGSASVEVTADGSSSSGENTSSTATTTPSIIYSTENALSVQSADTVVDETQDVRQEDSLVSVTEAIHEAAENIHENAFGSEISVGHDMLEDVHVVYAKDTRPLDRSLRNELQRSRFNPWDPRNLFASVSLSGIWYSVVWAVFAASVIYFISRKREV